MGVAAGQRIKEPCAPAAASAPSPAPAPPPPATPPPTARHVRVHLRAAGTADAGPRMQYGAAAAFAGDGYALPQLAAKRVSAQYDMCSLGV